MKDGAHDLEARANYEAWRAKPLLRRVYRDMFEDLARELTSLAGPTVEIGSGIGNIREVVPDCIRTDMFPAPWLDRTENAYELSFASDSVANLILFDVFHHLRYPGTALRELERVLAPGGRLLIFEPCMSLLGRVIFGLFHPEPIALRDTITWLAPDGWNCRIPEYYAAQGNASRIFGSTARGRHIEGLELLAVKRFARLSYVASGGYSKRQLYPDRAYPVIRQLDRVLDLMPAVFATRLLVVLQKPVRDAVTAPN